MNRTQRGPGQQHRIGDARRIAVDQREVRSPDRHVRTAADRHAEVGPGQRGRVIDAVTGHGHPQAVRLELPYHADLAVRANAGKNVHVRNAELGGDRPRRALVIPGDQHRPYAEPPDLAHRIGAARLDAVADREHRPCGAAPGKQHRRPPGIFHTRGRVPQLGGHGQAQLIHMPRAAKHGRAPGRGTGDARAGQAGEPGHGRQGAEPRHRGPGDGLADRMLRGVLHRPRDEQALLLVSTWPRDDLV